MPSRQAFDDDFVVSGTRARRRNPNPVRVNELQPQATGTFEDPYTKLFEDLAKAQISRLQQPFNDPGFDDVIRLINSRLSGLQTAPALSFSTTGSLGPFIAQGMKRIDELNAEPFSPTEEARMKNRALTNIEADRTAAKQRATEDAARRGLGEGSGIIQEMYRDIDRGADANRTTAETDLAMYVTSERNNRRNQATQIASQLAAMGLQEQQMLDARTLAQANFNNQREGQILSLAGFLADLNAQRRGEERANQNDILQIALNLSQLTPQRIALLMQVLNGSGDPSAIFGNTLNLSNAQQNQRNYNSQGMAGLLAGLGQMIGYLGTQQRQPYVS